jgi:hypothetical protein
MLALNYLGLAVGLSVAAMLLSLAYQVWKYKPRKRP